MFPKDVDMVNSLFGKDFITICELHVKCVILSFNDGLDV